MTDVERVTAEAPEVVVYGAATCEDTAITRSRLLALGVAFEEVDIDADPGGLARVIELEGRRVTPTVVIGDRPSVVAEPSIEQLEELIRAEGAPLVPPSAGPVRGPLADGPLADGPLADGPLADGPLADGPLADGPIPPRALSTTEAGELSPGPTDDGRAVALFLAHETTCLACYGYAKQLARQAGAMGDAGARPVIVSRDAPDAVRHWADEVPAGATLLGDPAGAWTREILVGLSAASGAVALLVLDRDAVPRAVSVAAEAGGLVGPAVATGLVAALASRP